MRLSTYITLTEKKDVDNKKRVVFTFGRFNPPTRGHAKLINKVKEVAGTDDHLIFVSQTIDKTPDPTKSKNPLSWAIKIQFLKKLFPDVTFATAQEVKTPFQVLDYLNERGYTDIEFVVGSDRMAEFQRMEKYSDDLFNSFKLHSAGSRDPDSDDVVSAMSATKAREAAAEGDIGKFRAATGWDSDISKDLMAAVRRGMGL